MNILFIGPYRQSDGWGEAAKDFALALSTTGFNITIRPIYMSASIDKEELHTKLIEMEENKSSSYDVVIQKVLPPLLDYDARFKNVGLVALESSNMHYTSWISRMNIMDEMWVISNHEKQSLINTNKMTTNVEAVSEPINTDKYSVDYEPLNIPHIKDNFAFYFIGEYVQRKNLVSLIIAFHREFHINEPVQLVIKTNRGGINGPALSQILDRDISTIKQQLRLYPTPQHYKKEILMTERLPYDKLMGLHLACDCFVMPSCGEAFCRPAVDALGFGKTPIVNKNTGMGDIIDESVGWPIDSYEAPILISDPPLPDIYTARETWTQINILEFQKAMREAYESDRTSKIEEGKKKVYQFSHDSIGKNMKQRLEILCPA